MDLCGLRDVFYGLLEGQFDSSEMGMWQYTLMRITFPNKKGRFQELITDRTEKLSVLKAQAQKAHEKFLQVIEPEKRRWEKWVRDGDETKMSKRRLDPAFTVWLSTAESEYNKIKKIEKEGQMLDLEIEEYKKNIGVLDEVMEKAKNSRTYIDMKSVYRAGIGLQAQGAPLLGEMSEEQFEYNERKQEEEDRIIMQSEEYGKSDAQKTNDFEKYILKALTGQADTAASKFASPSPASNSRTSSYVGNDSDDEITLSDTGEPSQRSTDMKKKKAVHTYY